jgi:hypothetical protein
VNRIFLTLATISNLALVATFLLGWSIGDAAALPVDELAIVGWHFLAALGSSIIVLLVHAVALTYFMGTGRWIEETSMAYAMPAEARTANVRLKYQVLPGIVGCMVLVVATGALGAVADPASPVELTNDELIHFLCAAALVAVNLVVSAIEYDAIRRNGEVVDSLVRAVHERRASQGLPTTAA